MLAAPVGINTGGKANVGAVVGTDDRTGGVFEVLGKGVACIVPIRTLIDPESFEPIGRIFAGPTAAKGSLVHGLSTFAMFMINVRLMFA